MLCELKVKNLALIESLHLKLCDKERNGLVVLTGETGAGKSIMLRAINLLSGGRASTDWIRDGADSCVVEALFDVSAENSLLRPIIERQGLDVEDVLVFKRVVTSGGRSRMYINGSPATVKMGMELALNLLNVASQHDHQKLLQAQYHLDFLDTIGETVPLKEEYDRVYFQWRQKCEALAVLQKQEREKEQRRDFLEFQINEINTIAPAADEDELLSSEKKRLKSSEQLIRISRNSHSLLAGSLQEGLARIRVDMTQAANLDDNAAELAEELASLSYQADDVVVKLYHYLESLNNDPRRLEIVTERLNELQGLKRKYGATIEDVLKYLGDAQTEIQHIRGIDRAVAECQASIAEIEKELREKGAVLSEKRKKTAVGLEGSMARELASLAFNQAVFEVKFQEEDKGAYELFPGGIDRVEFFFSANPGEPVRPLVKVASGGELSRLMLAFKCLLARKDMVETVIFDEVDAGIGGEAAEAVARKIQELSSHHQVFCITHLPQIAARGNTHYLVKKGIDNGRTMSEMKMLDSSQRVDEISRMLAGESVSEETRAWASELLRKARVSRLETGASH